MKRFTDTAKWNDPWFMGLSPTAKLLWVYLCDHCDNAGVIQPNEKLAAFQIGSKITTAHYFELGDRLLELSPGKMLIPKFIRFQFGVISPASPVHRSVLKIVEHHGLKYPFELNGYTPRKLLESPKSESAKADISAAVPAVTALDIYDAYPRKISRADALRAIVKAMKKMAPEKLLAATRAYAVARAGEDSKFTPYPATWFNAENYLDDPAMWLTPSTPTIAIQRAKKEVAELSRTVSTVPTSNPDKESPIDMSWMNKKSQVNEL